MSTFRFKQFTIRQDRCAMKVGTDGVLLGAWVAIPHGARRILDIGAGTGLIALMLAQRTEGLEAQVSETADGESMLTSPAAYAPSAVRRPVRITGVDVDDVSQACENAAASPWAGRVDFVQCPVQEYRPAERFDLIVSNPPFYVDSLTSPDAGRTTARHAVALPYEALCDAVVRLLAPGGRFAVILPTAEAARFRAVCRGRLVLCRRTDVRTTPRREVRRVLMEFAAAPIPSGSPAAECSELVVGTGRHEEYTPEYRALTREFYLKF